MGYGDGPFTWVGHTILAIVSGFFWLVGLLVFVAVVVLLVRFLLIGTKAAQIYVAKNSPEKLEPHEEPAAAPATTTPAPAAPATPTKPVTKPRTPKTPPTA